MAEVEIKGPPRLFREVSRDNVLKVLRALRAEEGPDQGVGSDLYEVYGFLKHFAEMHGIEPEEYGDHESIYNTTLS